MSEKIFALDIGTRSVVGIILEQYEENYHVVDLIVEEHTERAMVDGQIHNVVYVAEVIAHIKNKLEEKHGPLTKVAVAAAGRSLKTEQAKAKITITNRPALTQADIDRLELAAVQQAQANLLDHQEQLEGHHYYCVAYSVLYNRLDGQEIGNLIDQQGNEASIEVIATFLPRVVVESLIAALKRAGLEMDGLTLEPIAAINALIPTSMRRLNVALVDIGAGTSDIAITDQSTVTAYGMVPTAGDEITEALSDHYLLDFPVAETLKRELSVQKEVTISDILGFDEQVPVLDVIQNIEPAIDHLASTIANEILKLNGQKSPKAVILIGGGSLTPQITSKLSHALALPDNRVAVRDIDAIKNLTRAEHVQATPELVTPIGIAISAKNMPIKYMAVQVNNQIVRMFELKEMTVTDALLSANINASKLYGKPGLAMSVSLNGQTIHIPGELGSPTMIKINGEIASMKTAITNEDVIELIEGTNGMEASATASDLIDNATSQIITLNGQPYSITAKLKINGSSAAFSQQLHEGDEILVETTSTLQQLMTKLGKNSLLDDRSIPTYYLNEQKVNVPQFAATITVNGMACSLDTILQNGDAIEFSTGIDRTLENFITVHSIQMADRCDVTFQGESIQLSRPAFKTLVNHREADLMTSLNMNDKIQLLPLEATPWTFQDVFKFTNWQLPEGFKGTFELVRNHVKAQFDQPIHNGDELSLRLLPSSTQV